MFRQGGLTPSVTGAVEFIAVEEERGNDATNFLSAKFYRAFRCAATDSTLLPDPE